MPLPHYGDPRYDLRTIPNEEIRKHVEKQISYIFGEEYRPTYWFDGMFATNYATWTPRYENDKFDKISIGKTQSEILFNLKVLIREKKLKRVLK